MSRPSSASRVTPESLAAGIRLGEALRRARIVRGLTQEQLATRAGVGRLVVGRLERGDTGVAIGLVMELILVLDPRLLDEVVELVAVDVRGAALARRHLPSRVRETDDF